MEPSMVRFFIYDLLISENFCVLKVAPPITPTLCFADEIDSLAKKAITHTRTAIIRDFIVFNFRELS